VGCTFPTTGAAIFLDRDATCLVVAVGDGNSDFRYAGVALVLGIVLVVLLAEVSLLLNP
jgi:hypothetical protein